MITSAIPENVFDITLPNASIIGVNFSKAGAIILKAIPKGIKEAPRAAIATAPANIKGTNEPNAAPAIPNPNNATPALPKSLQLTSLNCLRA